MSIRDIQCFSFSPNLFLDLPKQKPLYIIKEMRCEKRTCQLFRHFFWKISRKVVLIFAFANMLVFVSCENEISKIKIFSSTEDPPSVRAEGVEMLESDSTIIRSKLQAPEFIQHDDGRSSYVEFPKGVKIEKYDAKMNIISSVTASYAKNFSADDRWEAKNNVVAINMNGDTLKTEYLVMDNKKKKIYSDKFYRIITKDQEVSGIGFETNLDFTIYNFSNPSGHLDIEFEK